MVTGQAYHLYAADISPFAQRVVLQMEYKGLVFSQETPPGGLGSDEYGRINPIRKLPVLRIGETYLPESEVICEYLEHVHPEPALLPEDPTERAHCRLISRIVDLYIMNPMMPPFRNFARATRDQAVVDQALEAIRKGVAALECWLAPGPYVRAGRITLADFAAAPVLRYVAEYPPVFGMNMKTPFAETPNVATYLAACRADPHIERGLARIEAGWLARRSGQSH
jgi:glutathione S-transferase